MYHGQSLKNIDLTTALAICYKNKRIKIHVESHTSILISAERSVINSVVCWTAFHSRVYVLIFVKYPKQHRVGREIRGGGYLHRTIDTKLLQNFVQPS